MVRRVATPFPRARVKHPLALAVMLLATWFLWSDPLGRWLLGEGHAVPLLAWFGLASVGLVVWLTMRMGVADEEGVPLSVQSVGLITYVPWLVWQVLVSNLDVARRVWVGSSALEPQLIQVKPTQKTYVGRVLYANSITLTPGTISVRMYDGEILVHALHGGTADDALEGTMDRKVTALERGS